jgi:hypothetical protein
MYRKTLLRLVVLAVVCLPFAAVETASAYPTCKQWRIGPVFEAVQENGFTVRFQLRQWDTRLAGNATYTTSSTNLIGQRSTKTTYGDVGLRRSNMAGNRFTARVQWYNGSIGNYSAYIWYVQRMSDGGLWAELKGNTYPESGGASANWRTYSPTGQAKPVTCFAADVVEVR